MSFPSMIQHDFRDCGPTCLRIIVKHYGKEIDLDQLKELSDYNIRGTTLKSLSDAAENIGFRTLGAKLTFKQLWRETNLPCVVHWKGAHFAVVYKVTRKNIYVSDPAVGLLKYSIKEFLDGWLMDSSATEIPHGVALLLEPSNAFSNFQSKNRKVSYSGLKFVWTYLKRYKTYFYQLTLGLLIGSGILLFTPFLYQLIIDEGVSKNSFEIVILVLVAQLVFVFSRMSTNIVRDWLLLHMSTRINIALLTDFFIKLMKLPISFFDVKMTGDLLQRIEDHKRIEVFLTNSALSMVFSIFSILIFGIVLYIYDFKILLIFAFGSFLYLFWILYFMKKRRKLDYQLFSEFGNERGHIIEMINGMQELKLFNAEKKRRWEWESLQAKLYKLEVKSLKLEHVQSSGSQLVNEITNVILIAYCAYLVINGEITIGVMLSISFILGQLNAPLQQLVGFFHSTQDAKIALERLGAIHGKEEEDAHLKPSDYHHDIASFEKQDINLKNVWFKYKGNKEYSLKDISLKIPENKITAVVGESGSGKSTLMRLLLKYYLPSKGKIEVNGININSITSRKWRENCGVVMQEGYIFNDTIAQNIAIGVHEIDIEKLKKSSRIAGIDEFIESIPKKYETIIGNEGKGISVGQKQRILIARAIYNNPSFLLLDEATSSLDAKTEKIITDRIKQFLKSRTALIIAHRLSTIKNADQIIVLKNGKVAEIGTHEELLSQNGEYVKLFQNQFELQNKVT